MTQKKHPRKRKACGSCRECCIVLAVEPMAKPADTPCEKLCAKGCSIYEARPMSCKAFTCAYVEGLLPSKLKPNLTHTVIWSTKIIGVNEAEMPVLQANVAKGREMDRKTFKFLLVWSYSTLVILVQGGRNVLYQDGQKILAWDDGDFFKLEYNQLGKVVGGEVTPRDEILVTDADKEAWARRQVETISVPEDDPQYRANQVENQ